MEITKSKVTYPKSYTGTKLYPDCIRVSGIRDYIFAQTRVRISQRRVTQWVKAGDLPLIEVPKRCCIYKWWTRASYIDKALAKHMLEITGG